ncbi:MAG: aldehyde dehydrogenase family protein, partial [Nannocystaceae bacterium]
MTAVTTTTTTPAPHRVIEKFSPVTGDKLQDIPVSTSEEVDAAVARARAAFAGWRDLGLQRRLEMLDRIREVLLRKGEEYAREISRDTGKPYQDSISTELLAVALLLEYNRKQAPKILRRRKTKTPMVFTGKAGYIEYFPRGVVGVIAPWNFPFQLSVAPVISALVGGNTVVLKPSEVTPLTGEVIRDLMAEAKLPPGVVEVVQGDGSTGAALCNADVDMLFFTGSVATGRKVMQAAAKRPIPVELELGGKDAMIVCADANLARAAKAAAWGGFANCGQVCVSVERLFVVDSIHDKFVDMVRKEVEKIKVGGPDEDAD